MEHASDRIGHLAENAELVGDRRQLLDEERIPLSGFRDLRPDRGGNPEHLEQRLGVALRQRLEDDPHGGGQQPGRPQFRKLWPAEAEE